MNRKFSLVLLISLAWPTAQLFAIGSTKMVDYTQKIDAFLDTDSNTWTASQVAEISDLIDQLEKAKVQRSQIPQWRKRLVQQGASALKTIDLNQKLAQEQKKAQDAQARVDALNRNLAATQKQLASAKDDINQFEQDLSKKNKDLKSSQANYTALETAAAQSKAALEDAQKKYAQQQAQRSLIDAQLSAYEQALAKQKAEADAYEKGMTLYTNTLASQKDKLAKEIANLKLLIESQKKELQEAQLTGELLNQAQKDMEAQTQQLEELTVKSADIEQQNALLGQQLAQSKKAQEEIKQQSEALKKQKEEENKKIAAELSALKAQAVQLAEQLKAAPQKEKVEAQLKTLEDQISALVKAKENLESDKSKLKKQLEQHAIVLGGPDSNLNPVAQAAALLAKADTLAPAALVEKALQIYAALPTNLKNDTNVKSYSISTQYAESIGDQASAAKAMLKSIQAAQHTIDENMHKAAVSEKASDIVEKKVAAEDGFEMVDSLANAALKKAQALDFEHFNDAAWADFMKEVNRIAQATNKEEFKKLSAEETIKKFGQNTPMGNLIGALDDKLFPLLGAINAGTRSNIEKVFNAIVPAWPKVIDEILSHLGFDEELREEATGNFEKYKAKAFASIAKLQKDSGHNQASKKLTRDQAEKYINYVIEQQEKGPKKPSDSATDNELAAYTKEVSEYVADVKALIDMIDILRTNKEIIASLKTLKEPITNTNARDNKFTTDLLLTAARRVLQQIEDEKPAQ